ncbi:hypothetical protein [Ensifer adhaerens]|uniref:hypothetical protein n=1 Tax=Ensifer adhaerens TaxID=106592 RepID=UPI00132F4099|nr:hypothetical protein [Ensifer adhaerens]QHG74439.1 hypothetical protein DQW09_32135 [Ensifer adhaerens]
MTELLYIDEEPAQGNMVLRAAVESGFFGKAGVDTARPLADIDEMIDFILESKCKVLISDYRLGEKMLGISYTGLELIETFRRRFDGFPCFLITNFVGDALNEHVEVNMIFPKSDLKATKNKSELPFFHRVRAKIEERDVVLVEKSDRFQYLQERMTTAGLGAVEMQELLDLDDFLEGAINKADSVPRLLKERALQPFDRLIETAEKLVEKIELELSASRTEADKND